MDLNHAVAAELDAMRRYADVTQADLAVKAGLSLRSVQRYLDGERPIRIEDLARLSDALGVDPLDVFRRAYSRVKD